jgi:hypothetical protein
MGIGEKDDKLGVFDGFLGRFLVSKAGKLPLCDSFIE